MAPFHRRPTRIAIIGGGITGLAAAYRLRELDPSLEVGVWEAATRLGGVLRTTRQDGYLLEEGADNFVTQVPWAVDLCRRLGLADQLVPTNSEHRGVFVVHRGRLHSIPPGFTLMAPARLWPMLKTPLLSPAGKVRLAAEPLIRARCDGQDESIACFVERRLGRQVYQRLVQPLIGSIYGSDPAEVSLLATMPHFAAMEREHGSLYRAMQRTLKKEQATAQHQGARYSMFVAPRDGMESIVQALAEQLPDGSVHLRSPVTGIKPVEGGRWSLSVCGPEPRTWEVDGVIMTTPAAAAARLLREVDGPVADEIEQIPYSGSILVTLGYRRDAIRHPLHGFGFVVPLIENRPLLSASFTSVKYPGRAPEGTTLIRVFLGGGDLLPIQEHSDDELIAVAAAQLRELLGTTGAPCFAQVVRHPQAMPLYRVGHLERVARIECGLKRHGTLQLAGAAYHGIGVPQCIKSGELAAEQLVTRMRSLAPGQSSTTPGRLPAATL